MKQLVLNVRTRSMRRRASTLIFVVAALVVLGGLTSLAVDWGRVQLTKVELERSADAGARAGVAQLSNGVLAVQNAVVLYSGYNVADNTPVVIDPTQDIDFGLWDAVARSFTTLTGSARSGANAVRVNARRTAARGNAVPLLFGTIVGMNSCDASASSTVASTTTTLDYTAGFTGVTTLSMNGATVLSGSNLRLTTTVGSQNGSAWNTVKVPITNFSTYFYFQITSPVADGFTFAIQRNAATSVGSIGIGLGYSGLAKSAAVKFDIYNNSGEGTTSTGLYLNGALPTNVGSNDMTAAGVNLRSGHVMKATLNYNGVVLSETILDTTTNATFSQTYTVDLVSTIGGNTAYVGFTGGTGGSTAVSNIQQWYYTGSGGISLVH